MNVAPATREGLERHIGDEAEGQTVGHRVGERHGERGDDGRHRFGAVTPVEIGQVAHHQAGHEHQRGGGGIGRHHGSQRREEEREQEECGHGERGQARAAAGLHAGSAFHVSGGAGGAQHRAGHDGGTVGHQRAAQTTVLIRRGVAHVQAGATGHAHQRAGGVEQLDQEQHQHHVDETAGQRTLDVERQERGRDGAGNGHHPLEVVAAHQEGQCADHENADEHRARHFQVIKRHDEEEAQPGQQHGDGVHITQRDQSLGRSHHNARVAQADDGQKEPDACRGARPQRLRDAGDEQRAQPQGGDEQEEASRQEHGAQRCLPAVAHGAHHGVGEVGIEAHARGNRDGIVGIERHDGRAQRRHHAGSHEHRALGHAGAAQDGRVDEQDVGHRQEGGDAGQDLGLDRGAVFVQLEGSI